MKKIILLLLLIPIYTHSQTTEIEYNYLTKGYSETVTKGLDLKKGYELNDFYNYSDSSYEFDFKLFTDEKTKKTKAIFVLATSKIWNNKYYLCIPFQNEQLFIQYSNYLKTWDKEILKAYSLAFSEIITLSIIESEK